MKTHNSEHHDPNIKFRQLTHIIPSFFTVIDILVKCDHVLEINSDTQTRCQVHFWLVLWHNGVGCVRTISVSFFTPHVHTDQSIVSLRSVHKTFVLTELRVLNAV
jgi:hypothetical protein